MKKVRYHHGKNRNKISRYLKVSSAVLVISTVLIGHPYALNVEARATSYIHQQPSLESYIQQSKSDVEKWESLSAQQKSQLNTDITQAKSIEAIDQLLSEAKAHFAGTQTDRQLEEAHLVREHMHTNIEQFFAELDNPSNKVDRGELNEVNDDATLSARRLAEIMNQKEPNTSDLKNEVQHLLSVPEVEQGPLDQYVATKEESLKAFESKLATQSNVSNERKALLNKEIQSMKRELNEQNDVVRQRLNASDDKTEAIRALIGETLNDKQAAAVLKRIQTNGKSNRQIANQVVSQLDRFTSLSSDDLLRSMLEDTTQRKDLIETLLSTRFESTEATKIADQILKGHPTTDQIVERLKQHYGNHMTADDILDNVFDQTYNQRQALETILKSKFSPDTARALAERMVNNADSRGELLKLLKSDTDAYLNQLIKANNEIQRLKSKFHEIFDPLKHTQDVLNQSHGHRLEGGLLRGQSDLFSPLSIFDQLMNGKSILDNIPDLPNPTQGRALFLIKPTDSFLSGLFDHEGNFNLPAAGQIVKQRFLPVGVIMIVLGSLIFWRIKRHRSRKSS